MGRKIPSRKAQESNPRDNASALVFKTRWLPKAATFHKNEEKIPELLPTVSVVIPRRHDEESVAIWTRFSRKSVEAATDSSSCLLGMTTRLLGGNLGKNGSGGIRTLWAVKPRFYRPVQPSNSAALPKSRAEKQKPPRPERSRRRENRKRRRFQKRGCDAMLLETETKLGRYEPDFGALDGRRQSEFIADR